MPTTYTTSKTAAGAQARAGIDITAVSATFTLTAALVTGDIIQMVKIPAGAVMLDVILSAGDLGAGYLLEVGDGTDPDRFVTSTNIAQAGGMARMNNAAGNGYVYTAEDTIDVKAATGGATGVGKTLTLTATYQMQS